jgi:hypothetical protein
MGAERVGVSPLSRPATDQEYRHFFDVLRPAREREQVMMSMNLWLVSGPILHQAGRASSARSRPDLAAGKTGTLSTATACAPTCSCKEATMIAAPRQPAMISLDLGPLRRETLEIVAAERHLVRASLRIC